ncbi:ABC transporter permease subunit [Microbacterium sp. SS28]|uniref:ABC transporter permease subunit n=1 Tax=Microbacterium sp. SS28 TaxID=2919948 RepID=UPI001FAAB836|nr:ABC transporter permease subunit [Microbacterium sp. SS28]
MSLTQEATQAPPPGDGPLRPARESHARNWRGLGWGFVVKLILMMLINAFGVLVVLSAYRVENWFILVGMVVIVAIADWVYFSKRTIPLKYLLPGLIFLFVFQIFIFAYTAYIAFTNYGTGHAGTQEQAVQAALIQGERRVEGSETYPLTIVQQLGALGFAINDGGTVRVGTEDQPLNDVGEMSGSGAPTEVPGWDIVDRNQLLSDQALQDSVIALRVPVSDDPNDGALRTRDAVTASIYTSTLVWDESAQTITDTTTGTVYHATEKGTFTADDGTSLPAGWAVNVGFENFTRLFTDPKLAEPMLLVFGWTLVWSVLSVIIPFALGLFFALVYNDPRVRGRKWMRTLFILPYAFPAFMSALVFRGMFNKEFGVINDLFFFGADINWLGDPTLARIAVLWVNVWLSYPYWLLVCTGALQAIPGDALEAAEIDGAGRFRRFRSIILPLLLVSTAPLAISSFAVAFNNFTVIYMFNNGGPSIPGAPYALGYTDILISAIYDISGVSGGAADYGLASALSIIAFLFVGIIAFFSFRQTRKLEEFM